MSVSAKEPALFMAHSRLVVGSKITLTLSGLEEASCISRNVLDPIENQADSQNSDRILAASNWQR